MPYRFDFESTNRILRGRLVDEVTDEELMDYYRMAALLCETIRPDAGVTDLCSAVVSVSSQTVRKLAKLPPALYEESKPRFIVACSDHVFGLARMFQMEGEDARPNLHVVRSEAEAWMALGVDELNFQPVSKALRSAFRARFKSNEREGGTNEEWSNC